MRSQAMNDALMYNGFSWTYEGASEPALREIDLRIGKGEAVGIVGANEQGKTTLARTMNGLIPNNYPGRRKGRVRVFGKDPWSTDMDEMTRRVGLVFSNPDAQFTSMSVEEELLFGLENCYRDECLIQKRLQWARDRLGLGPLMERPPYELSGGQKQRVAIASVLVLEPDLLVLDEPTSMLDPVTRERIFDLLADLKTPERTLVVIEHNLELMVRLVDRIIDLKHHTVFRDVTTQTFINRLDYGDDRLYPPEVAQFFARRSNPSSQPDHIPYRLEDAVQEARSHD